jgi:hypothetical protein
MVKTTKLGNNRHLVAGHCTKKPVLHHGPLGVIHMPDKRIYRTSEV